MGISTPFSEIKKFYKDNGCELLLDEADYSGNQNQKASYICKCGDIQENRTIRYFMTKGQLCSKCAKELKAKQYMIDHGYGFDAVSNKFQSHNLKLLTVKEVYHKIDRVDYECITCGNKDSIVLAYFSEHTGCKSCKEDKRKRILWNQLLDVADNCGLEMVTTFDEFNGRGSHITLRCNCDDHNEFSTVMEEFLYGSKRQCNNCGRENVRGENSWRWHGGITPENDRIRRSAQYIHWRNAVFERDNYTCQCCNNSTGGNLEAHHIFNFSDHKDIRFDIRNGITLCNRCHNFNQHGAFHQIYGARNNNMKQLQEFFDLTRSGLGLPNKQIETIIGEHPVLFCED